MLFYTGFTLDRGTPPPPPYLTLANYFILYFVSFLFLYFLPQIAVRIQGTADDQIGGCSSAEVGRVCEEGKAIYIGIPCV